MDTKTIEQMTADAVEKALAEYEAGRPPVPPSLPQETSFREVMAEHALLHGVRPHAIRHVVRDAVEMFELQDGALVARNGATDPSDPLSPLTPGRWLQELAKKERYLFNDSFSTH
jgi:hypothetical protein